MEFEDQFVEIIVIGAGIAGIMAAWQLQNQGKSVLVLEKSRGVGGRMATRRIGAGRADTGAQFFTIRSPIFQAIADEWLAQGLIFEWSRGWSNGSLSELKEDGHPRYGVYGGMTGVAKSYRPQLTITHATRVAKLSLHPNNWLVTSDDNRRWSAQAVIITAPVPQALAICAAGDVPLSKADNGALERITYAPCLCAIYRLNGAVHLPPPGALQRPGHEFSWIADNLRKGISPQERLVTVHMHPARSKALYDEPDHIVQKLFDAEMARHIAPKSTVVEVQIKRWRYALPLATHDQRTLQAEGLPPLLFAGDGFNGPRIEGAVLSGLAAAERLQHALT